MIGEGESGYPGIVAKGEFLHKEAILAISKSQLISIQRIIAEDWICSSYSHLQKTGKVNS